MIGFQKTDDEKLMWTIFGKSNIENRKDIMAWEPVYSLDYLYCKKCGVSLKKNNKNTCGERGRGVLHLKCFYFCWQNLACKSVSDTVSTTTEDGSTNTSLQSNRNHERKIHRSDCGVVKTTETCSITAPSRTFSQDNWITVVK